MFTLFAAGACGGNSQEKAGCIAAIANGKDCKPTCFVDSNVSGKGEDLDQVAQPLQVDAGEGTFTFTQGEGTAIVQISLWEDANASNPYRRARLNNGVWENNASRQPPRAIAYATGIITGPHEVLTAAHTFVQAAASTYNRVTIGIVPPGTTQRLMIEPIFDVVNSDYRAAYSPTAGGPTVPANDIAGLVTRQDMTAAPFNVRPVHIMADYPAADTGCECMLDTLVAAGYEFNTGPEFRAAVQPTGITVRPRISNADAHANGVLTFGEFATHGDSGAPLLRFNHDPARQRWEVVGLIAARRRVTLDGVPAGNDGTPMGTVVATLTTANLQNLTDQYQADLAGLPPSNGNPPPPATVLPNGRPSTVWTSYRETATYSPEGTTGVSTNWPEFNVGFPRAAPTGAVIREGNGCL